MGGNRRLANIAATAAVLCALPGCQSAPPRQAAPATGGGVSERLPTAETHRHLYPAYRSGPRWAVQLPLHRLIATRVTSGSAKGSPLRLALYARRSTVPAYWMVHLVIEAFNSGKKPIKILCRTPADWFGIFKTRRPRLYAGMLGFPNGRPPPAGDYKIFLAWIYSRQGLPPALGFSGLTPQQRIQVGPRCRSLFKTETWPYVGTCSVVAIAFDHAGRAVAWSNGVRFHCKKCPTAGRGAGLFGDVPGYVHRGSDSARCPHLHAVRRQLQRYRINRK